PGGVWLPELERHLNCWQVPARRQCPFPPLEHQDRDVLHREDRTSARARLPHWNSIDEQLASPAIQDNDRVCARAELELQPGEPAVVEERARLVAPGALPHPRYWAALRRRAPEHRAARNGRHFANARWIAPVPKQNEMGDLDSLASTLLVRRWLRGARQLEIESGIVRHRQSRCSEIDAAVLGIYADSAMRNLPRHLRNRFAVS